MSTRCQVLVIQEGIWEESVMLYHHCDGYPEHMVPTIAKARSFARHAYQAGRAGNVAAFLCATEPTQFEPESGCDLHGDIEYFYKLFLVNTCGGSTDERPVWELEILKGDGKTVLNARAPILVHKQRIKQRIKA